MSEVTTYAPWVVAGVAVAGFLLNCIIQIRGGAWNAASRESKFQESINLKLDNKFEELSRSGVASVDKVRAEMTANLASINADIDSGRRESHEQHKDTMSRFGDTVAALREKVNQDALYAERAFLKREDFNLWTKSQNEMYSTLDRKVDDRFNRIETLLLNRPWPHTPDRPAKN